VSAAREAAARRGRLREFLRNKTQADAMTTQSELLQQLGSPVTDAALRTLRRDLRVLRGVLKRTPTKHAGGVNRSEVGSNMNMTKKIRQLEDRLDGIENVQMRVIDFLAKATDFAAASRKNEMILLDITNRAAAERAALREKYERMDDKFTAAYLSLSAQSRNNNCEVH
jgi:hypothetical protein